MMPFDSMNSMKIVNAVNYITLENSIACMSLMSIILLVILCKKTTFSKLAIVAISLNGLALVGFVGSFFYFNFR